MIDIQLRPEDQVPFKAAIYDAWNQGAKNVMGVAVTGFGKSVVTSDIVLDHQRRAARQCVMAHRNELVSQLSGHIAERGIFHRIIAPREIIKDITAEHRELFGRSFINPDAECAVAGVDTLISRQDELRDWCNQVDDFTIDEGHHCLRKNKWGRAVEMFPRAKGLLLTATPQRADGMGLGRHADGVVDTMVLGPTLRQTIDRGFLCDYEIVCPPSDLDVNDDDLAPSGDFSPKKMKIKAEKSRIVGDVVQNYVKYAYAKRAICFAIDIDEANKIAASFNAVGIPAAAVSSLTPRDTRREYIKRFREGRIWILINVDLFDEGFDVPACEVVIMARPTASLGKYLQMIGRALRRLAGKQYGLIIDHVSNVKRHGFPDKPHFWTTDRRDKKSKKEKDPEDIDTTVCRSCSKPYIAALIACPHCGEAPPLPAPGGRTLETVAGDLVLMDREALAVLRAAVMLESPADMAARVEAAAGTIAGKGAANRQAERHAVQAQLRATLDQWAGCMAAMGRDEREWHRRFYAATDMSVLHALAMSRQDMEAMNARVMEWIAAHG